MAGSPREFDRLVVGLFILARFWSESRYTVYVWFQTDGIAECNSLNVMIPPMTDRHKALVRP